MTKFLTLIFAVLLGTSAFAQDETTEEAVLDIRTTEDITLDDFLWLNRVIVVFADSERDPTFKKQLELLAERPLPLLERDVVILTDTSPDPKSDIRKDLRPRGFAFVFVDKDGVVKLRKPAPWHVREISRSIDKTDLRQQEIRDERIAPAK